MSTIQCSDIRCRVNADALKKLAELGNNPFPPPASPISSSEDPVDPSTATSSSDNTAASAGAAQGATSVSATGGGGTASTAAGGAYFCILYPNRSYVAVMNDHSNCLQSVIPNKNISQIHSAA